MQVQRRVLLVTHTAELGGAEIALLRLIDAIDPARFVFSACLFAHGALERELTARGIPVHVVEAADLVRLTRRSVLAPRGIVRRATASARLARRVRALSVTARADVVVANSLKAAMITMPALLGSATPWVWHLHDRLHPDYLPRPLIMLLRTVARVGPRRVVANSEATAATLGRRRSSRVVVAYPGLDPAAFAHPRTPGADGPIGMIGRVSATKGQRQFLDAVEMLEAEGRLADYRIIGAALFEDAAVEQALRERTERTPALQRVHWTGWVAQPARELRALLLCVHASPVPEPFGQVVVEAMAARVPVIATDAGGIREILDADGAARPVAPGVRRSAVGLLVAPADPHALAAAIGWALDYADDLRVMADTARQQALARFPIALTAAVVEQAWREAQESARKKTMGEGGRAR